MESLILWLETGAAAPVFMCTERTICSSNRQIVHRLFLFVHLGKTALFTETAVTRDTTAACETAPPRFWRQQPAVGCASAGALCDAEPRAEWQSLAGRRTVLAQGRRRQLAARHLIARRDNQPQ